MRTFDLKIGDPDTGEVSLVGVFVSSERRVP